MAFYKWFFLLRIFCVCSDVDSTSCIDFSSITFGIFEIVRQSNVQYNSILYSKEHNRDSWTFHIANNCNTDLLLHDKLCSNTVTVLFALFDLFFDVILWWIDWSLYWKCDNGLERYSCGDTNISAAYDCFLWVFQKQVWLTKLVWMVGVYIAK